MRQCLLVASASFLYQVAFYDFVSEVFPWTPVLCVALALYFAIGVACYHPPVVAATHVVVLQCVGSLCEVSEAYERELELELDLLHRRRRGQTGAATARVTTSRSAERLVAAGLRVVGLMQTGNDLLGRNLAIDFGTSLFVLTCFLFFAFLPVARLLATTTGHGPTDDALLRADLRPLHRLRGRPRARPGRTGTEAEGLQEEGQEAAAGPGHRPEGPREEGGDCSVEGPAAPPEEPCRPPEAPRGV